jgi:tRNA (Thr-GGU) A37 N-methylase
MSTKEKIVLKPIGHVKTSAVGDEVKDKTLISQIVLSDELVEGLAGISGYSHLFVLFYLNQITDDQRRTLRVHPRGRMDLPLTGVSQLELCCVLIRLLTVAELVGGEQRFDG